jgi:hypothetical protein
MIAAREVRSTLADGTRAWHVVQTADMVRALSAVRFIVGPRATVELTGTTFHDVADGVPYIAQVHRSAP